jgi:DNA-binding CsgD family transcriptional regulator
MFLELGEYRNAETLARSTLRQAASLGAWAPVPDLLDLLAALDLATGVDRRAVRLAAAADAARTAMGAVAGATGITVPPVQDARARLGDDDFDAAWREGQQLSLTDAVAYVERGKTGRKRPPLGWDSLTPTESSVVQLAAEGLSNADIARRLLVSRRTVDTHLTRIYAKLELTTRTELVAAAARRG